MNTVLAVLSSTLVLLIDAVQLCMFIHAILSWVSPPGGDVGPVRAFINAVTEYATLPVRILLERFEWSRRTPIDLSYLITFLLLSLLSTIFSLL